MNFTKLKIALGVAGALLVAGTANASTLYFNGFETDINGWMTPTRVASGTGGITSSDGAFHATTSAGASDFTRWGGYNFGAGPGPASFQEFWTSTDIYLDIDGGWANNTRFDFDSAMFNASGGFLRDFIFNAAFFNDNTGPGAGTNRFVISASNNSQPGSAFAKNPGMDPIAISTEGWYTFGFHFFDSAGQLTVVMSITDSSDALVHSWTKTTDPIATVGGNAYGWFDYNEFSTLAFDNTELRTADAAAVPEPGTMTLLGLGFAGIARAVRRRRK